MTTRTPLASGISALVATLIVTALELAEMAGMSTSVDATQVLSHDLTESPLGVVHKHSTPVSVMRMGSVTSMPPSSSQSAGMK